MTQILKSLEALSIGYSVFEKDQVLTHDQLNSISGYFEDQSRLTRITLVGVGVVCGLRVALQGNTVTVARGVGVTTDGDLLSFAENTVFDKFRAYDKTNPAYGPFYLNGDVSNEMISVYELVRAAEAADGRTALLSRFATQAGKPLANMVAVLFMESYVTDRDLCSGTDCDNLGQDCNNRVRLLLVDKAAAGTLHYVAATPHKAFGALNEIVADRPLFSAATNAPGLLAQTYRTVCTTIHNRLLAELPKLYQHGASFLARPIQPLPGTAGLPPSRPRSPPRPMASSIITISSGTWWKPATIFARFFLATGPGAVPTRRPFRSIFCWALSRRALMPMNSAPHFIRRRQRAGPRHSSAMPGSCSGNSTPLS